jgi:hypothetical protein
MNRSIQIESKCGRCESKAPIHAKTLKDLKALEKLGWGFYPIACQSIHIGLFCPECRETSVAGNYRGILGFLRREAGRCKSLIRVSQRMLNGIEGFLKQ